MKIALLATYELGRPPFGLASPAAWLRQRGHEVTCLDLSRQSLDEEAIRCADLVAFHVPMHTATRLAIPLLEPVRRLNSRAHICFYGLYASVNESYLRRLGVQTILGGEFEAGFVSLAQRLAVGTDGQAYEAATQPEPVISLARQQFLLPDRAGLPPLGEYARLLLPSGEERVAGYTEASRGCKHLCRHCPIVPVYNGTFRVVGRDVVLADVRQQVAAGAQHISFGDADFFNGIGHALAIVEAFHAEFPNITYDVVIKIEHLRHHERHLATLRDTGCLFVTSAVEALDDAVLARLDKGHTRADFLHVVGKFREIGLGLQPTFVPFTPWTTIASYLDLLQALSELRLIENVAPVQLAIRLLIPAGSRLLELEEVQEIIGPFDEAALVYPWKHDDPRMDALSAEIQRIAGASDVPGLSRRAIFERVWNAAHRAAGIEPLPLAAAQHSASEGIAHFSEPWYCCAEPTRKQLLAIAPAQSPAPQPASFV